MSDCAIHNKVEEFTESDFWRCFECGHVYKTEQEVVDSFNSIMREYLRPSARQAVDVPFCPPCLHDW